MAGKSSVTGKGDSRSPFKMRSQPTGIGSPKGRQSPAVKPGAFVPRPQPENAHPAPKPDMRVTLSGVAGAAPKPTRAPKPPGPGKGMKARR